jgi:hypothetical protein
MISYTLLFAEIATPNSAAQLVIPSNPNQAAMKPKALADSKNTVLFL